MKTCANCGQTMKDEDLFCGNCGAMSLDGVEKKPESTPPASGQAPAAVPPTAQSAPNAAPPAAKPSGNRGLGKLLAVVAVVVVVVGVAVVGIAGILTKGNQSLAEVGRELLKGGNQSFADVQREFLLDGGVAYVERLVEQYNAMTNVSTDLTITMEAPTQEYARYLEDSALRIGLETQRDAFAMDATLQIMGSDILGGVVALEDGMLTLALPEVTEERYVLDLKELIYEASGIPVSELALPELSKDTMTALLKTYFNIVLSTATEDNVTVEKDQEIALPYLEETVNGTLYVFEPTAEDVENMLLELADALESDEDLREFVISLTGNNLELVEAAMGVDDLDAQLQESLNEAAQALRDNAESIGQEVEDAGFTWTVGYADGRVCYQEIALESESYAPITYESIGEAKDGRQDVIYLQDDVDSVAMLVETEYIKEGGAFSGTLRMSQWEEELLSVRFDDVQEKQRSALGMAYGTYSMTAYNYGTSATIELQVEKSPEGGSDHKITLSGEEVYYSSGLEELVFHIHSSDEKATIKMPDGPEVDITSLTDSDLEELSMLIQERLMNTLAPLFADAYGYDYYDYYY